MSDVHLCHLCDPRVFSVFAWQREEGEGQEGGPTHAGCQAGAQPTTGASETCVCMRNGAPTGAGPRGLLNKARRSFGSCPPWRPFLSLQGNHFLATDVRRSPDSCAAARSSAVVLSLSPSQGTCAPFVGGSVPTWRKEQEGWGPQRTHRGPTGVWLPLSADRPLGTPGGATTCPSGAPRRAPCPPRPGCERASAVEPISPSDVVGERKRAFPGMLGGRLRGGGRSREHLESGSRALSGILASSGKTARRAPHAPGGAQG